MCTLWENDWKDNSSHYRVCSLFMQCPHKREAHERKHWGEFIMLDVRVGCLSFLLFDFMVAGNGLCFCFPLHVILGKTAKQLSLEQILFFYKDIILAVLIIKLIVMKASH